MNGSSFFTHSSAVVHPESEVGEGTRIWHFCHVAEGARIGKACVLGQNCFVAPGAKIGDRVRIQNNVSVYAGVEIEDDVFVGPSVVFTNVRRPRAFLDRRHEFAKTLVQRGASIGANATILPGVVLGEYCLIGAGSVVASDVPAFASVLGVPGEAKGWVSRAAERLEFHDGLAECAVSGDRYRLHGNRVELAVEGSRLPLRER